MWLCILSAGNLWIYMKTNSTRVVGVFGGAQLAKLELLTPAPVLLSIQYRVNLVLSVSKPDTVALYICQCLLLISFGANIGIPTLNI